MPVQVAMDVTALGSGRGGDETYVDGLLRGLAATAEPGDRVRLFARPRAELPPGVAPGAGFNVETLASPGPGRLVTSLPARARRRGSPGELFVGYTHLPVPAPRRSALVVTDLSFRHQPEHYPLASRVRLNTLVPRQARRASAVVTLTEFCKADLVDAYGLSPERVVVVPCSVTPPLELGQGEAAAVTTWARGLGLTTDPFVLYLGNLHPRKNVRRLIEAFAVAGLAGTRLVVAGGRWWRGSGEEESAARLPGRVVLTGRVSDAQRSWLLRSAAALAYPSLFEGFGLPPLEAMSVGTPVLASDAAALPETCGDGALLVDARDVEALADGLRAVVGDEDLRRRLRAAGPARASEYSVQRAGAALRRAVRVAEVHS